MEEQTTGCLVCGAPLEYFPSQIEMECTYCHKTFMSNARCVNGHFICDSCHEQMGLRVIEDICRHTDSKDPVAIMKKIILSPYIYMHGPEHHVLVGSALLAAYKNAGRTGFGRGPGRNEEQRGTGAGRYLRFVGNLRGGCEYRYFCQPDYRGLTLKRKRVGALQ